MAHLFQLLIIIRILSIILAEWIEITQQPSGASLAHSNRPKSSIKILQKTAANIFAGSEWTTPSPQWIEYQRERFGNGQNTNSQKLIVSAAKRLKNSAQIVVPANKLNFQKIQTKHNDNSSARNQLLQAKTRFEVFSGVPRVEELRPQLNKVETTSRRDMSYDDVAADNDNNDDEVVEDDDDDDNSNNAASQHSEETAQSEEVTQTASDDADSFLHNVEPSTESGVQFPSVQGFFRFLKSIQRTWLKKSGFGIEHKINLLKRLRDNLMRTIEQKFSMLWQQPKERLRRRKRGILDESSLNFPPEAALISINFLTFAVFLIKLVLQVVHIVKSKHYSFTGLNTGTMQTINRGN